MKKTVSILICVLIILQSFILSASAISSVTIEQVLPIIPEITAVLKIGTGAKETVGKDDCFAKFGDETLTVKNLEKFDSAKHKSTVYFLVDSSSSINGLFLNEIKKKLVSYSDNLPANEKMVLISFGLNVKTLLNGNESKETRKQKINSLMANEGQTNLFNAIKYAVELSQSNTSVASDRAYAVVISDGENYETGGGNTQQEVTETVSGHGLPIYALCVGASRSNASEFGSLARKSGGEVFTANYASAVSSAFDNLVKNTKNVYILSLSTKSNEVSDGSKKALMVRAGDKSASADIKSTRWIKDDNNPTIINVKSVKEDDGKVKLYLYFSENVLNADNAKNFKVTRNGGKKEYTFSDAEYHFEDGEFYSVLTSKKELPKNSDYKISVNNITDSSNEQNILESTDTEYELGLKSGILIFILSYWWIALAVLALAGLALFICMYLKKKNSSNTAVETQIPVQEQLTEFDNVITNRQESFDYTAPATTEKHHIISQQGKPVTLKINDGKSSIRTVNTSIVNKIVIGRSDSCNIYLDDLKMSRFHFEIEMINGELWINDLNSANGTYLNNMKISGKRKLKTNDIIVAGQATFTIIY